MSGSERTDPADVAALYRRAVARHGAGDIAAALRLFADIVDRAPDHLDARQNLALILAETGKTEQALDQLDAVLSRRPDFAPSLYTKGKILSHLGRARDAERWLRRAVAASPDDAEARRALGWELGRLGSEAEAESEYRRALEAEPGSVETLIDLASLEARDERLESAEATLRRALALAPEIAVIHNNLGNVLKARGRFADALAAHGRARALAPGNPEILCNLASDNQALGHWDAAEACFRAALDAAPDHARAHWHLGLLLLSRGDLAAGWRGIEWRFAAGARGARLRRLGHEMWDGRTDLAGALLIWGEQGVGDEILCAGMIAELAAAGMSCILECDPRLQPLFARSFPDVEVVARAGEPDRRLRRDDIEAHCPAASLGRWRRPDFDAFPDRPSYLSPDPARIHALRDRYGGDRPLIGLSWHSRRAVEGRFKSLDLERLAPVLACPGVRFVNLQYGDCAAEIAAVRESLGVDIIDDADIDSFADLDGFAAQVAAMDAVVSTSNTTVHMAGALGVTTLAMVPTGAAAPWYWFAEGTACPWYPAIRLIRQPRPADWTGVVEQAAEALAGLPNVGANG